MKCPQCSFENRDGSKFCNECGCSLSAPITLPVIEPEPVPAPKPEVTADLSGIERIVASDLVSPSASWRSGSTAELPRVGEEPQRLTFQAPYDDVDEPRSGIVKRAVLGAICLAVIAALILFATYFMELWGGKTVPDVVGRSQTDATYMLEAKGFVVRSTQVKSDDVEGIVLLMDPASDSRHDAGSEVVIHVSVARVVPPIVGIPKLNAENMLEKEGFTNITFKEVKSDQHEGMVLSVAPEASTKAKAGTAIIVEVAVPFTVPEVSTLSQEEAVALLEAEGYSVTVDWTYNEEIPEGSAVSTQPSAGSEFPTGSTVVLYLAKSRANELINATKSYFGSQEMFVIGDSSYSVDASSLQLTYEGEDTVRYVVSARRAETHYWELTGEYETKYGEKVTLEGLIYWDEATNVLGGDPTIYRAR